MYSNLPKSIRRSQLYRLHEQANAVFAEVDGAVYVDHYTELASQSMSEADQYKHLGLADLSTLSRIGFKGRGAPTWLTEQGAQLPEQPNTALPQSDGSLLVRLSSQELLLLQSLQKSSVLIKNVQDNMGSAAAEASYFLPRADSHCWLVLTGEYAPQALAKVCGVDMRVHKFAVGDVAQTSVARANTIVIRHELTPDNPCFYLLCDVSLAVFIWESLLDAMQEFNGRPIGLASLKN
ncbi:MAG: sarcosine oxidase [Ostreibacterium sp.]